MSLKDGKNIYYLIITLVASINAMQCANILSIMGWQIYDLGIKWPIVQSTQRARIVIWCQNNTKSHILAMQSKNSIRRRINGEIFGSF